MEKFTISKGSLVLSPLKTSDFERLFEVGSDPEIWKMHPDFNRYQREGFTQYFNKIMEGDLPFLITDNGNIIGATSYYDYDEGESQIAIGYSFLKKSYWGTSTNKTIKNLMLKKAFEFVDKVIFHVASSNIVSQKALANIGAIKVKEYAEPEGSENNKVLFQILKKEYKKID